ncbi:Coatomer subunit beta', partial [Zancudomyces culisetae]
RIDVAAIGVYWSDSDLVAVATSDSFYVLKYNRAAVVGANITDEGVEDAIEFVVEIQERIVSATWIGGCLIYTNAANRLNYLVGGQCFTIAHFANPMQLLGYISRNNCVYLVDKDYGVVGYSLPLAMIEYQTAILRRDLESAASLLPDVPSEMRPRLARFLEAEDLKDLALLVTTDREHKFDLAIQLQHLDIARSLAEETGSAAKWRAVADCAMGIIINLSKQLPPYVVYSSEVANSARSPFANNTGVLWVWNPASVFGFPAWPTASTDCPTRTLTPFTTSTWSFSSSYTHVIKNRGAIARAR